MFNLISSIQNILLNKKKQKLIDLRYKDLIHHDRPTELEKVIPFNYFDHIESPPSNDSTITKKELFDIKQLIEIRSESSIDTILIIDKDPLIIFKSFLNKNQKEFPELQFSKLYSILYDIILDIKYYYNRPRPNQIAEFYNINLNILNTETHHTPSYPSGHTAYAALAYELLSEKYPDLASKFYEFVQKTSRARIMQGIHFLSDTDASIRFVHSIYPELKKIIEEKNYE